MRLSITTGSTLQCSQDEISVGYCVSQTLMQILAQHGSSRISQYICKPTGITLLAMDNLKSTNWAKARWHSNVRKFMIISSTYFRAFRGIHTYCIRLFKIFVSFPCQIIRYTVT